MDTTPSSSESACGTCGSRRARPAGVARWRKPLARVPEPGGRRPGRQSVAPCGRIARALNLSLSGLFARRDNNEGIVRADRRVVVQYGDYQDELVSPSLAGQLLVLVCRVEPGANRATSCTRTMPTRSACSSLRGRWRSTSRVRSTGWRSATRSRFASRRGHGWHNPGRKPAAALWVMTPPRSSSPSDPMSTGSSQLARSAWSSGVRNDSPRCAGSTDEEVRRPRRGDHGRNEKRRWVVDPGRQQPEDGR